MLAKVARSSRLGVVTVDAAAGALNLDRRAASVRLGAMARRGWLTRVRRGVYLVLPPEATPSAGAAVEDPWVLAHVIYHPCYVGGWSAAEYWGLTEQIFRPTFVVTAANVRARRESLLGAEFHLVRVNAKALAGALTVWRGKERVPVSDRERTIVDAANHPDWVGGARHMAGLLLAYQESPERSPERLAATLAAYGRGAAHKRLGYLAESLWPEATAVLEGARAGRSTGVIKLDPSVRAKGHINKRWGLWLNVTLDVSRG